MEIKEIPDRMKNIDFPKLLRHFIDVQNKHKDFKKTIRTKDLFSEKESCDLIS